MRFISIYFLVCSLFFSQRLLGQNDFGAWMSAEVKTELSDRFDVALEAQLRLNDNASHIQNRFLSPSVSFKAHKFIRLGISYRLSSIPYNSSTSNRVFAHRYTFDLEFQKIMDLIKDKWNFGISMRFRETTEIEAQKLTENTLRYKVKFDYNIPKSKFEPFISGELFYRFNNQLTYTTTEVVSTNAISKLRLKIGASYKLNKRNSFKIYSIIQKQLLSQRSEFILGIGYAYSLKIK